MFIDLLIHFMEANIQIQQTMTSLEIAELTGKQHKNLMRDIRNMEPAWEKVNGLKFELIDYKDPRGRLKPCYLLTKTETLYFFRDRIEAAFRSRNYVGNNERRRMGKNDTIYERLDFDFGFEMALQHSVRANGASVTRNQVVNIVIVMIVIKSF